MELTIDLNKDNSDSDDEYFTLSVPRLTCADGLLLPTSSKPSNPARH